MAGDWIKWQKGLSRKPEVVRMASLLRLSRREVASMCMEFWEWCDETIDESTFAPNGSAFVTLSPDDGDNMAFIDTLVGTEKFADSLTAVEWLRCRDGRIELPGFSLHNGETAKTRARNAKNQKKKRDSEGRQQTPDKETPAGKTVTKMSPRNGDKTVTRERERERDLDNKTINAGEAEVSNTDFHAPRAFCINPQVTSIAIGKQTIEYHEDAMRWEAEFVRRWNKLPGVGKRTTASLDSILRQNLTQRLMDETWDWKQAFTRFPIQMGLTFVPSLSWFLKPDTVSKILDGAYRTVERLPMKTAAVATGPEYSDFNESDFQE